MSPRPTNLQKSEQRFKTLAAGTFEGIAVTENGKFLDCNDQLASMLGYERSEIIGQSIVSLVAPEDRERVIGNIKEGVECRVEHGAIRKDGSHIIVETHGKTILQDGVQLRITAVRDITERKLAEDRLSQNQLLLQSIIDNSSAVIFLKDIGGHYLLINRRFTEIFHLNKDEVLGRTDYDFLAVSVADPIRVADEKVRVANTTLEFEEVVPQDDGPHTYLVLKFPLQDANGKPYAICGIGTDITERKRDQEAIRELNQNLEQKVRERTRELEEKEAQQRSLNRALRLLSSCSEILIHAKNDRFLLNDICRKVVEDGGYLMAWVGFSEQDDNKTVRPVAESGFEDGYLNRINITWADTDRGRGPTGTAIRTGITQINQDCFNNPLMIPWREAALKRGYQSSIALPLINERKTFGALTIYAKDPFAFKPEEIRLLEELANSLAFGIIGLRTSVARNQAEELLKQSEIRYRLLLENAADAVLVVDPERHFIYANNQASKMLGCGIEELLKMSITDIVLTNDSEIALSQFAQLKERGNLQSEIYLKRCDGSSVPVDLNAVLLPDGNLYASCRDITERLNYETQLEYRATRDGLTGLANRSLFNDRLDQEIKKSQRSGEPLALLFVDLDSFKEINDTLGHQVGDVLLIEVARRILACVRETDTVARLGGDEFLVILPELSDSSRASIVAEKIIESLAQTYQLSEERAYVTASLGISIYPSDAGDSVNLLIAAERAMYLSKNEGRNRISYFTKEMQKDAQDSFQLAQDLHDVLPNNQFQLYFQPIVNMKTGQVIKAEALIRWLHPKRGMVSPVQFIPIAERSSIINSIGNWVFKESLIYAKRWTKLLGAPFKIGINMSPVQFMMKGQHAIWIEYLQQAKLHGDSVIVELTEGILIKDRPEVMQQLLRFRDAGIEVAIDDFGTGYSSLSYLNKFHIDYLKIDQSFTRNLAIGSSDLALSKAIIVMAHELGMKVIAEGIETDEQRDLLINAGCDFGQGYLFSKPVPANEFEKFVGTCVSIS